MNGFHEWDDYPETPKTQKEIVESLVEFSESKIRWGIIAAIVVVISTCIFLLAYC
jgi:hypothetical protein